MLKNKCKIVTYIMMALLVFGCFGGISVKASVCPPHGALVDRYLGAEAPTRQSHLVFIFHDQTNSYTNERCYYMVQNIRREIYCTDCSSRVSTYTQQKEYQHDNPNCPKHN